MILPLNVYTYRRTANERPDSRSAVWQNPKCPDELAPEFVLHQTDSLAGLESWLTRAADRRVCRLTERIDMRKYSPFARARNAEIASLSRLSPFQKSLNASVIPRGVQNRALKLPQASIVISSRRNARQ